MAPTPFLISYRVSRGRIEILALLHGAREWPDAL
jgi:plasmid stabilization system protein ParE